MTASALSILSLAGGIGAVALLVAWLATRRRYTVLRILAGVFVIVAVVSGYVSRRPEKPVAGEGSLVGARQGAGDPTAAHCAQARAFGADIPAECRR
ncbi:hypothetical protein [Methylorubrum aminovorans]